MPDDTPRTPEEMPEQSAYATLSGIRMISGAAGEAISEMPVTEALTNRNGALHGGAIMTLADNAAGTAAFMAIPAGRSNTTIESKTNFLRGVRVGDTLTATCETLHRGRTILVFQITMTRRDGKVAAVSTQTHMVIDWAD